MTSILIIGLLLGIRHALEADHVAAVATLATTENSLPKAIRLGLAWGLGHTVMLFIFGGIILFMSGAIPERLSAWLEIAVGVMLMLLGLDVIRRVIVERVHFHTHTHRQPHGQDDVHFHAHSHKGVQEKRHDPDQHDHQHGATFPLRALLIGMIHGIAGTAALILLTLQTLSSAWLGLLYIALFGLGSMIGMAAFTFVLVIPLRATRHLTGLYNGLQLAVGLLTILVGAFAVYNHAVA